METNDSLEKWAADVPHEQSASGKRRAVAPADGRQARRKRLDEYESAALAKPDAGDAIIALVKSDLVGIAFHQGKVIRQMMAGDETIENLRRLDAPMNDYLRVVRQIRSD